jgi:hypothetical protein
MMKTSGESDDESSGTTEVEIFLDQLSDYKFLKVH